jgi:general secretion pathway protein M
VRLSAREQGNIAVAAALLLTVGFWLGVWEPTRDHLALLDRKVAAKRAEYREIQELAGRFARLKDRIEGIEVHMRRSRKFSILSYLEGLAKREQVKDRIVQMKPKGGESTRFYRENTVEIKMEKVRLTELVGYLFKVENSPELLRVKQVQARPRFDDPDLLDVKFQVSAYEPLEAD